MHEWRAPLRPGLEWTAIGDLPGRPVRVTRPMTKPFLHASRILIADDTAANVRLLRSLLDGEGYTQLKSTSDAREVLALYTEFEPDLLLLDLHMPHLDGFDVLRQLRAILPPDDYFPVLMLTADFTSQSRDTALALGAKDFLNKPFDMQEALLRIENLLETRFLHRQLRAHNQELEVRVALRTRDLTETQAQILARLARAAEYRDDATGQHTQRVGRIVAHLAMALGLRAQEVDLLRQAAPLHDVGKIGIPDAILLKAGRLTPEEFDLMKSHTRIGAGLLGGNPFPLLRLAEEIALSHHEHWDGSGYPEGLQGDTIPLGARLVAVADVFDSLTHERPYKHAWSVAEAAAELQRTSGRQFDPRLVPLFLALLKTTPDLAFAAGA